jgi:hypothetical protein
MRKKYHLQILIVNQKEKKETFMCSLMNIACTYMSSVTDIWTPLTPLTPLTTTFVTHISPTRGPR